MSAEMIATATAEFAERFASAASSQAASAERFASAAKARVDPVRAFRGPAELSAAAVAGSRNTNRCGCFSVTDVPPPRGTLVVELHPYGPEALSS